MNISAGDVLLEVIGQTAAVQLERLSGVRCASVLPYARLGDATLRLSLEPELSLEALRHALEASGLRVLGLKRAA